MVGNEDDLTERTREIEALCAMLEFSKARAEELGLTALSLSLEGAIKIAQTDLAATGSTAEARNGRDD